MVFAVVLTFYSVKAFETFIMASSDNKLWGGNKGQLKFILFLILRALKSVGRSRLVLG